MTGQDVELENIAPYLTSEGTEIASLFDLVEGTVKQEADLDLGAYQGRPANFDALSGENTASSLNPYDSLNEFLEAAGLNPDFSGTPNWSNVLNTPEGASALEEYISALPPNLYEGMAITENLSPDAAEVLLACLQEGPEGNKAAREIFFKSIDPTDPLYNQRGNIEYSNRPWTWPPNIPYAGIDFSGTNITGSNLNPP